MLASRTLLLKTLPANDICTRSPALPGFRPRRVTSQGQATCAAPATVNAAATLELPRTCKSALKGTQVAMRTLQDCELAISVYPTFTYDARSGGGVAETSGHGSDRLQMSFDPQTLSIPDVSYRTAKFLGVPLPPMFKIAVITRSLRGWLEPKTGEVQLNFVASFFFTASLFGWVLFRAPPLEVVTRLTTEKVQGRMLGGRGSRIDQNGFARLVGVADVQKSGNALFDAFLRLPGDTFSVMSSHFTY